jgi:hypothetical protein
MHLPPSAAIRAPPQLIYSTWSTLGIFFFIWGTSLCDRTSKMSSVVAPHHCPQPQANFHILHLNKPAVAGDSQRCAEIRCLLAAEPSYPVAKEERRR